MHQPNITTKPPQHFQTPAIDEDVVVSNPASRSEATRREGKCSNQSTKATSPSNLSYTDFGEQKRECENAGYVQIKFEYWPPVRRKGYANMIGD